MRKNVTGVNETVIKFNQAPAVFSIGVAVFGAARSSVIYYCNWVTLTSMK